MTANGPFEPRGARGSDGDASGPFAVHRDAFGAELRRAAPKVRQRRRRRLMTLGGTSIALASAATAAAVIVPTTGSRLDVIAEAQAAITTTPDSIIHYAATVKSGYPLRRIDLEQRRVCKTDPAEVWVATAPGPPRHRIRSPLNPCGVAELGAHIATGPFDRTYANRTSTVYSESDGFMDVVTDLPAEADEQEAWSTQIPISDTQLNEGDSKNPVARIRSLLAEGKLTDAGEVEGEKGRKLRRLVGQYEEMRGDPKNQKPRTVKVDYRVDADTFAPVRLAVTQRQMVPKDPNLPVRQHRYVHRMLTDVVTFSIFETLPLTKDNERLLTVEPKAGTDVTTVKYDPNRETAEPSAAEKTRARRAAEAQIKSGTRKYYEWNDR